MKYNDLTLSIHMRTEIRLEQNMRERVAFPKSSEASEGQRGADPVLPQSQQSGLLRRRRAPLEDAVSRSGRPVSV